MPVTAEELAGFTQFALDRVNNGDVESLEECLALWREHVEVNAAIDRGLADIEAGRFRPIEEFWKEFCDKHGIAVKS